MTDITEINNWLKNQYIFVKDDWLQACVEWILDEGEELSLNQIKESVYEQWLVADLQDIGSSHLPHDISYVQKSIQGNYTFQILAVQDVSQSSYSQLLKISGKENENVTVSATPMPTVPTWEIKPSRMLMLTLTDGNQILKGMEYKPIPFLHAKLLSGTKITIFGPVECRLGVLILTDEKIKILGGEVESLIKENSQKRILLRTLGQDENNTADLNGEDSSNTQNIDSGIDFSRNSFPIDQNQENNVTTTVQRTKRHFENINLSHQFNNNSDIIDLTILYENDSDDDIIHVNEPDTLEDDDEFMMNIDYDELDQLVKENCNKELFSSEEEFSCSSPPKKIPKNLCKIKAPPPILSQIPEFDLSDSDNSN